ncbi:MAG: hypothetical protein FP825_08640 [Hyphomonas sp.]|uniref:hypothetical protein n=1 Tax=Hyphomonas sp. TaxID=87 RepID=UPI00184E6946|nr:hypothetical protein [Hyphomonas sp.]MBA3068533.1 hypothetical protein [Hyphomonas sp.]MBU4060599.1 hypothetical protein [Alphaproteobacteria bacterium]MBU4164583.1 hypothetical protein [Alphaproteobacteria bacterium]
MKVLVPSREKKGCLVVSGKVVEADNCVRRQMGFKREPRCFAEETAPLQHGHARRMIPQKLGMYEGGPEEVSPGFQLLGQFRVSTPQAFLFSLYQSRIELLVGDG